ncbi:helix-turn-helix domain-containing protein [Nonomuraea sp. NPDC059194]|uniref:helix-turn-helix domain-containing protein n=1 Tax=Nonomuraea sp. NPDC059194 TaxID=3346764 RepID=UPI0036A2669F
MKLVARSAMDYADFYDGTSCHPSNERLARETGYSERTIRTAWGVMRGLGLAERVSNAVAHARVADEYELAIPDNWANLPILGPRARKFTCLGCSKLFNPQGNCTLGTGDKVTFNVVAYCFCPAPRKTKGRDEAWCFDLWNTQETEMGRLAWQKRGREDIWKLFRLARGDDW